MSNVLNKAIVLTLNRHWQAIGVRTPQEAFCQVATNVSVPLGEAARRATKAIAQFAPGAGRRTWRGKLDVDFMNILTQNSAMGAWDELWPGFLISTCRILTN